MIKQLVLPLAGVAAFIILVGLLVKNSGNIVIPGFTTPAPEATSLVKATIKVDGKAVNVEIANTEASRELGLGGRTSLADDSGMLFIFDSKSVTPGFWMKGMLFPLDIVWIAGNKVVKIDKNIPAPDPKSDKPLQTYSPNVPIDYVLEVNAGYSDKNGVKVGSMVDLTGI